MVNRGNMSSRIPLTFCLLIACIPMDIMCTLHPCLIRNDSLECDGQELTSMVSVKGKFSSLNFSYNKLKALFNGTFKSYPNLEMLFLQGNDIENIESGAFYTVSNMVKVDLSENDLSYLHPDTFILNKKLRTVILRGNSFYDADFSAPFLNTPSVSDLDISFCGIRALSEHSFSLLTNLYRLDLSSNNLPSLSLTSLNYLPKIRILNVGGNLLECGCNLSKLLNWVKDIRPREAQPHRTVYCYTKTRERLAVDPGQLKHCSGNDTKEDAAKSNPSPTVISSIVHMEIEYKYYIPVMASAEMPRASVTDERLSESESLNRDASGSYVDKYQSDILSCIIVILMVIGVISMAFTLIRCFRIRYVPVDHNMPNNLVRNEHYVENEKPILPLYKDHTYEYVK